MVETERLITEGVCLCIVLLLAVGTVFVLDLAPLSAVMKSSSQHYQNAVFVATVLGIYAIARAYFHFAMSACDQIISKLRGNISQNDDDCKELQGAEQKKGDGSFLWRVLLFMFVVIGFATVYFINGKTIDSAIKRLTGDVLEILWKASEKEVERISKRGKRILGLFSGYFFILFAVELILRAICKGFVTVYRKVVGVDTPINKNIDISEASEVDPVEQKTDDDECSRKDEKVEVQGSN
jgi:hypothetical protein